MSRKQQKQDIKAFGLFFPKIQTTNNTKNHNFGKMIGPKYRLGHLLLNSNKNIKMEKWKLVGLSVRLNRNKMFDQFLPKSLSEIQDTKNSPEMYNWVLPFNFSPNLT